MAFMNSNLKNLAADDGFESIILKDANLDIAEDVTDRCFLIMDSNEQLRFNSAEDFCKKLKCSTMPNIKVVTILGNTGDGKSHTMNHVFFQGEEVFQTSAEPNSFTLGVYGALQTEMGVLCLDTEGLLSVSTQPSRRMRMLLKVMAISDIIIYRTRAERLQSDVYEFLGYASDTYRLRFSSSLQSLDDPDSLNLGPAVIVFHETRYTSPLKNSLTENAEDTMRNNFSRLNYDIGSFRTLRYVGIQTSTTETTDFSCLISAISCELNNVCPKDPCSIFETLLAMNKKYLGEISQVSSNSFSDQYFCCQMVCASCNIRCELDNCHEGQPHYSSQPCEYQQKFDNRVEFCQLCYSKGREVKISRVESIWTYSVLSCPHCGELTRTFIYWDNGENSAVVRTQTIHVWGADNSLTKALPAHTGQMVLDTLSSAYESFTTFASQPTVALREWCADTVAPKYWKANCDIIICFSCRKNFEKTGLRKHHCRGCGEGFCDSCTQKRLPVPARNWFDDVRICINCHQQLLKDPNTIPELAAANKDTDIEENNVIVRKYGETIYNTVSTAASAVIECAKEIIKDSARPDYWVSDADALCCHICNTEFGTVEELVMKHSKLLEKVHEITKRGVCYRHHCRKCGQGVCSDCSLARKPVPERGWLDDVRVCDKCANETPFTSSSS